VKSKISKFSIEISCLQACLEASLWD